MPGWNGLADQAVLSTAAPVPGAGAAGRVNGAGVEATPSSASWSLVLGWTSTEANGWCVGSVPMGEMLMASSLLREAEVPRQIKLRPNADRDLTKRFKKG